MICGVSDNSHTRTASGALNSPKLQAQVCTISINQPKFSAIQKFKLYGCVPVTISCRTYSNFANACLIPDTGACSSGGGAGGCTKVPTTQHRCPWTASVLVLPEARKLDEVGQWYKKSAHLIELPTALLECPHLRTTAMHVLKPHLFQAGLRATAPTRDFAFEICRDELATARG